MHKFYQKEWNRIFFNDFSALNPFKIADAHFYEKYYDEFFKRYHSLDQVDSEWLISKQKIAEFIGFKATLESKILSIGCGSGFIEMQLLSKGYLHLDVNETSLSPMRWLSQKIEQHRIHVGYFPNCLPTHAKYDLIYLSAVDYALDQKQWIGLLQQIKERLNPKGCCLVISASFEQDKTLLGKGWMHIKNFLKYVSMHSKLYHPGQLWGVMRSHTDYFDSMKQAGFLSIKNGFIEPEKTYWIEGKI